MSRISLHYNKFCGLARQVAFKNWLKQTSSELHNYLTQPTSSCKARAERMVFVYNKLYETGKGNDFEVFIKSRFPYIIDRSAEVKPALKAKQHVNVSPREKRIVNPRNMTIVRGDAKALNKHNVFKMYKPDILTFPQKRIIVNDNVDQLKAQISHFVANKLGVDYIIIEDRVYVEYFDSRYRTSVDKIAKENREIYKYRQAHVADSPSS